MFNRRHCLLTALAPLAFGVAAARELPDDLTLNVGDVDGVGTNVALVLTKRSMRATNYVCGIWTDEGFRSVTFPVSTYRGYVQGDPAMSVNANIEPGGIFNANIGAGRHHLALIREMKIEVPNGKCTSFMSTGNKVVPLASLPKRQLPTPSGCLVPRVPMRRSTWVITIPKSYTGKYENQMERVVSRVEQRWNDGDCVFARDVGTAWEIGALVLEDPKSTKPIDWKEIGVAHGAAKFMRAWVSGVRGKSSGKGNRLAVSRDLLHAGVLLHEGAHLYGDWCHQLDPGDGLSGGGAFFGRNNVQVMLAVQETPGAWCHRGEDLFPGVIYDGVLPPHAMRDMASTHKDKPVIIDVLENDYDGNGDEIFLKAVTPESAKGGTVVVHEDSKRAVYTPKPGFVGLDSFTYTVADSTGAANKSGIVKVDVRTDGLAVHLAFEEAEPGNDGTYDFDNLGPYDGGRATAKWIDYKPVPGLRGKGLLNPVGGDGKAQVDLTTAGDPGSESLSVSVWVLYPRAGGGLILCKSPYGHKKLTSGWAIRCTDEGFSFFGNGVRLSLDESENFELHSEEPVQSNTWYHLVMVMDRKAGKLRSYVNNKEVTASRTTSRIPPGVIEYQAPLRLFKPPVWVQWSAQPMLVDEMKIFTSALTPKQVAELYAEGKDAKVPKL